MVVQDRQVRHAGGLQPLRRRLGARDGHALPVDQAGRLALGRHAQRHDRPLAERHQGQGRDPHPVPSRHRRRADHPRGGRAAAAAVRQRRAADADRGRQHGLLVRRRRRRRPAHHAVLRDVLQPRHLPRGLDGGDPPQHPMGADGDAGRSTTTRGSSTAPTTGRRPTTSRPSSRTSCATSSGCSSSKPASTTSCRSTTVAFERFNADLAGRPQLDPWHDPAPVRRHGPAVRELRRRHQEQVARRDGRHRRPRRRRPTACSSPRVGRSAAGPCTWDGRPAYCYNLFGLQQFKVVRDRALPAGEHQVRMEFAYDGGGLGKGGTATLYARWRQGRRRPGRRHRPMVFSADETTDVGVDSATPVTRRLRRGQDGVHGQGALGPDRPRRGRRGHRPPHLAGGRFRVAMARQ